jgi:hypothetical protein
MYSVLLPSTSAMYSRDELGARVLCNGFLVLWLESDCSTTEGSLVMKDFFSDLLARNRYRDPSEKVILVVGIESYGKDENWYTCVNDAWKLAMHETSIYLNVEIAVSVLTSSYGRTDNNAFDFIFTKDKESVPESDRQQRRAACYEMLEVINKLIVTAGRTIEQIGKEGRLFSIMGVDTRGSLHPPRREKEKGRGESGRKD